jgi:hypothetical protein
MVGLFLASLRRVNVGDGDIWNDAAVGRALRTSATETSVCSSLSSLLETWSKVGMVPLLW